MAKIIPAAKVKPSHRSVHRIAGFCAELGVSRALYYSLSGDERPKFAKLGGAVIILETPDEYIKRLRTIRDAA